MDEDWDTDEPPVLPPLVEMNEGPGSVDTTTPLSSFIGPLPFASGGSEEKGGMGDGGYNTGPCTDAEVSSSAEGTDGRGELDPRGNYIPCIICLEDKPTLELRKHKPCGAAICIECLPVSF